MAAIIAVAGIIMCILMFSESMILMGFLYLLGCVITMFSTAFPIYAIGKIFLEIALIKQEMNKQEVLARSAVSAPVSAPGAHVNSDATDYKTCPICGTKAPKGEKTCPNCRKWLG